MTATRPDFGITQATPDHVEPVTDTLAAAFFDGDLAPWLIPDHATRAKVYPKYFRIFAEYFLEHGRVDATADLTAVALWLPVDDHLWITIADYDVRLAKATGTAMARFAMLDMTQDAHHPTLQPHLYLAFLAVRPEHQGEGRGAALLSHGLDLADQARLPAYLEATGARNQGLYHRHGFNLRDTVWIPGGPYLYPMWRPSGTPTPRPPTP